jgi:small conductance mechanosensitive channel
MDVQSLGLDPKDVEKYSDEAVTMLMQYGPKLVLAIITLVVGLWMINLLSRGISKAFARKEFDPSLQGFLVSLVGMTLKTLLLVSVAGMVGIEMTSFIAILGAAGLAVGMALSGTLQNFAGGVMILIFRPFRVGDVIEAQGFTGKVSEIQIFFTVMKTPDNKTIIVPNAPLSSGSLINYSTEATRRVDFVFGIGYSDDIDKAKGVIRSLYEADSRVLKDPEPFIAVGELADSSVNFTVRLWVAKDDYWGVHFDLIEAVKKEFDRQGISIPFPQRDIHLHNAA